MAYIIDRYNKYNSWDRQHSSYIFNLHEVQYAIKEIDGAIPHSIDDNTDDDSYFIYDTLEDAMQYVQTIKSLN